MYACKSVGHASISYRMLFFQPQYGFRCVFVCVWVCVCVCVIIQFPQEGQPRTASRCYLIFRFGSFSDHSVSYKTLKALWLCGLFSLQRETHRTAAVGLSQDSVCWSCSGKTPAGAVTTSCRSDKSMLAPPLLQKEKKKKHTKNHNGTITFSTFLFL